MTLPTYQECMKPVLERLSDGKPHSVKEIDEYIASVFHLTDDERVRKLQSGRTPIYRSRSNWARCYLKKAGLIVAVKRAILQISEEGKKVISDPNITVIDNNLLMRFASFRDFIAQSKAPKERDTDTPDAVLAAAYHEINAVLAEDLITEMQQLNCRQFERMVMELLKTVGYGVDGEVKVTQQSRDSGIDGIISEDKLGFSKIYVQIKQFNSEHKVSRPELQAFVGAIAGLDGKGLFVTLSDFTQDAKRYARAQNLVLLNGQSIAKLMIEHNFGVSVKQTYAIKILDTDLFAEFTG